MMAGREFWLQDTEMLEGGSIFSGAGAIVTVSEIDPICVYKLQWTDMKLKK